MDEDARLTLLPSRGLPCSAPPSPLRCGHSCCRLLPPPLLLLVLLLHCPPACHCASHSQLRCGNFCSPSSTLSALETMSRTA